MAESAVFILFTGFLIVGAAYLFNLAHFDARYVIGAITLALIPGFYAAFTSGPFVPSTRKRHQAMLELANIKKIDVVYDMGFGDGRLIFAAAKKAKKSIGYELSIPLYLFGLVRKFFSRSRVHICFGNIWKQDYRDADVIFCYLLPSAMVRFYKKVWPTLKPGARVVSNAFQIHDVKPVSEKEKVYLYVK